MRHSFPFSSSCLSCFETEGKKIHYVVMVSHYFQLIYLEFYPSPGLEYLKIEKCQFQNLNNMIKENTDMNVYLIQWVQLNYLDLHNRFILLFTGRPVVNGIVNAYVNFWLPL